MLNKLMALSANLLTDVVRASIGEAAIYALIGFIVVFIGIAFLIFIVWLVGQIMSKKNNQKKQCGYENKQEQPSTLASIPVAQEDELTDETVAVIMAALMAYYQQSNTKCDFVVKRIKRI